MLDLLVPALAALAGAGAQAGLAHLREYRRVPAGLADLLPWVSFVGESTIVNKDGSFLTAWAYRGPDLSSATPQDLAHLGQLFNDALLPLGDGFLLHLDALRTPAVGYAPSGAFPDPVTALIDQERREIYERSTHHFETRTTLALTYLPPPEIYQRLASFFIQSDSRREIEWSRVLAAFEREALALEGRLAPGLAIRRLDRGELLAHLHTCVGGLTSPVLPPPPGVELAALLSDQDLLGGWEPRIGGRALRAVSLSGFPPATWSGILDDVAHLPIALRWSHRIIPLGATTAAREIRRTQRHWYQKRKGLRTLIHEAAAKEASASTRQEAELFHDQDAQAMAEDAAAAAAANASGRQRFCLYSSTILLFHRDAAVADHQAGEIVKALNDRGFPARIETVNALEAWAGSLPGLGYPNLRRPVLSSWNLADLAPLTNVWPGLPHNPSPFFPPGSPPLLWAATSGSTPFRLNLHDSDVGHTLVVGPTGAGKSTLVGLLVAQFFRYPGAQVFVFDVGYSHCLLARAADAMHYDIASGAPDSVRFQPLAEIHEPSERSWAAEWLELLVSQQGVRVTPALRTAIDRALLIVAQQAPPDRTLTELAIQLQAPELVAALTPYTVSGNLSQLLDSRRDDLEVHAYQVFELRHLLDAGDRILLPVLTYLFHRVERRLTGRPTLLVIEEAWLPLLKTSFADRIRQWLLTLRKQNAAVLLVTQSLAQLFASEHRHLFVESCPTRLLLPNPDAASPAHAALYRELGLNDAAIELIAHATPKRDYFFTSPRGNRLFELALGPVALAFLSSAEGMTLQETLRAAGALSEEHGAGWPSVWLARRGLDAPARALRSLTASEPGAPTS